MKLEQLFETSEIQVRIFLSGYIFRDTDDMSVQPMFAFFKGNERITEYMINHHLTFTVDVEEPFQPVAILPASKLQDLRKDQLIQVLSHSILKTLSRPSVEFIIHTDAAALVDKKTINPKSPEWRGRFAGFHPSARSEAFYGLVTAIQQALEGFLDEA